MSGWGQIYNNTQYMLRLQSNILANLQEQLSTGSRILRVSDAPGDAQRILDLNTQTQSLETYMKNINAVDSTLSIADGQLRETSALIQTATGLFTDAATDTSTAERETIGGSIDQILEQIIINANIDYLGQYIFSGSDTAQIPYEVVRDSDGKIIEVNYRGSQDEMPVPVAPGVEYSGMLVGEEIFGNTDRRDPIFFGDTGAAGGTGTSSVRGDVWLSVTHTSTTYPGGSGLAEGDDAALDTILGDHTITITGTGWPAGTVQLDDGVIVDFTGTGADTNLELTNSAGDVVYVDVTGVTGAGVHTITGQGTLSIDDGTSTVTIDFAEQNQVVTHQSTGKVLFVDGTGIVREGIEPIRVPGTYDLFNTLLNARDVMLNTRTLDKGAQGDLLRQAEQSLGEAFKGFTEALAMVGAREMGMETLYTGLENLKFSLGDQAKALGAADVAQVVVEMMRAETFYQMALATSARLLSLSLLDFI